MWQRITGLAAVAGFCLIASARGGAAPDLSTPKKALLVMIQATADQDMAMVQAASVGSADDYALLDGQFRVGALARKVQNAAVARFGAPGMQVVADLVPAGAGKYLARTQQLQETITGDTATLSAPGLGPPMQLKKIDGAWKVDLSGLDHLTLSVATMRAENAAREKILQQALQDIPAGRYATSADAVSAIQEALLNALPVMTGPGPASRPATEP